MKLSDWATRIASDPFRAALLLILLAGLILAMWHLSSLRKYARYKMEVSSNPAGVVFVLDQETGTLYFARQGQITEGWTDVWRKAPTLPKE